MLPILREENKAFVTLRNMFWLDGRLDDIISKSLACMCPTSLSSLSRETNVVVGFFQETRFQIISPPHDPFQQAHVGGGGFFSGNMR